MSFQDCRVVVVSRHALNREGMRCILVDAGFSVVALSIDQSNLNEPPFEAPELIVVESETADEGIGTAGMMRLAFPAARLVLITPHCDLTSTSRAFASGVDGYLTNSIACEAMVGALKLVLMGEKIVPTQIVSELVNTSFPSRPHIWEMSNGTTNLSDRETEILRQLVLGEANKVISRHLSISEATVKVHVKAILRKLRVLNRTQAAIWAVNHGIAAAANDMATQA